MALFDFNERDVITTYRVDAPLGSSKDYESGGEVLGNSYGNNSPVYLVGDRGQTARPTDQPDQFFVFHLNPALDGPTIIEASQATPKLTGSQGEKPDVLVSMQMESFHLAASEQIDRDSRVTMRITLGKDASSNDKLFDNLFWSVAAGLKLYNEYKGAPTTLKETKADLRRALGNRPIEVPGGLGVLSFEVIKHKEPEWWQRIFTFLQSDTADSLISLLGFPAITRQAIKVVDELLNRLTDAEPAPLFQSVPMRLALSQWARDEYTAGSQRIKIGCLNPGFCVLARGQDYNTIANANAIYMPTYNRLVPVGISEDRMLSGAYDDPLADVTYAIFRVGMQETRLDPTFNFRA